MFQDLEDFVDQLCDGLGLPGCPSGWDFLGIRRAGIAWVCVGLGLPAWSRGGIYALWMILGGILGAAVGYLLTMALPGDFEFGMGILLGAGISLGAVFGSRRTDANDRRIARQAEQRIPAEERSQAQQRSQAEQGIPAEQGSRAEQRSQPAQRAGSEGD